MAELNKTAEVIKVTDINTMIEKGVIQTPALIIDGKIIMQGKIPTVEQIKEVCAPRLDRAKKLFGK